MKNTFTSLLLAAFAMVALAVGSPVSSAVKIGSDCDLVVVDDASVCVTGDDHEDEDTNNDDDDDDDGILISLTPIDLELL